MSVLFSLFFMSVFYPFIIAVKCPTQNHIFKKASWRFPYHIIHIAIRHQFYRYNLIDAFCIIKTPSILVPCIILLSSDNFLQYLLELWTKSWNKTGNFNNFVFCLKVKCFCNNIVLCNIFLHVKQKWSLKFWHIHSFMWNSNVF